MSITQAPLYQSPIGLYDFQAEHIARAYYLTPGVLAVWDTGLGKTHLAMCLAALLVEDDLVDHILVCAEQSKVREWIDDFERFTSLETMRYHGVGPQRRAKLRENLAQVVVSTYETVKIDGVIFSGPKGSRKKPLPGPLTEALMGKRVMIVYDEATKLKNRTSGNHRAHHAIVEVLRKHGECRVVSLTATPIERAAEDIYNVVRITDPTVVGNVAWFERNYVSYRDEYDRATYINLTTERYNDPSVEPFEQVLAPIILRKRKTDPDVVEQFPEQIEEFWTFPLTKRQADFYEQVRKAFVQDDTLDGQLFLVLRQIAAHPLSLTRSDGELAKAIVQEVGETALSTLGAAKVDRLLSFAETLVKGQGDQALVFSFFGPSVLPFVATALREEGYRVGLYHGEVSAKDRERNRHAFLAGDLDFLLCSDAGARGLNFPDTAYVVQYEVPFTHSLYLQRGNRNHRIDSTRSIVLNLAFIAEGTIEDKIVDTVWDRNAVSDKVLGDLHADGAITAEVRRELLRKARR